MVKLLCLIAGIFLLGSITSKGQSKGKAPNIIFILADDLGYGDIQPFNPASGIPTPHLNLLAKQGLLFTNAHATSSVCTPSRYSFLTGRYPWRSRMKKGVLWVWDPPLIEEGRLTIGKMLQQQGYATACIGKWHLGWDWPTKDGQPATVANQGKNVAYREAIMNGPVSRGFDYYFGQDVPSLPPHVLIENDHVLVEPVDWLTSPAGMQGAMAPGWKYENLMHVISGKATDYIVQQTVHRPDQPFFLYLSLSAPHTPIAPQEDYQGKTKAGPYGDFVYEMDQHIGRIINTVDSLHIGDDTLIIFTSDNGGVNEDGQNYTGGVGSLLKYGHNSNGLLRGMKSDAWEGGHRIPFIVRWPGHVRANTSSDALISQVDMMATLAALTGAELPGNAAEDSYSILPLFTDPSLENIRDAVVTQSGNGILAIQKGGWKLILSSGGGGSWTHPQGELPVRVSENDKMLWENIQLYNVKTDISEIQNLASRHKEKVKELMALLKACIMTGKSNPIRSAAPLRPDELWPEIEWIKQVKAGRPDK